MQPPPFSAKDILHRRLSSLKTLQARLSEEPYSVVLRLELTKAYKDLGYPDLATGDAYKALLLIDEVLQDGEYHDEALNAAQSDITSGRDRDITVPTCLSVSIQLDDHDETCSSTPLASNVDMTNETFGQKTINASISTWSQCAYCLLIRCLIDCGCLRSAADYISRACRSFPSNDIFETFEAELKGKLFQAHKKTQDNSSSLDIQDYPEKGLARRELYPWNIHEPNRFSTESIKFLNNEMSSVAPKLEARVSELPVLSLPDEHAAPALTKERRYVTQLGVFAKVDIRPGEVVLEEKSILTAVSRLHDSYCDACSIKLPTLSASDAPTLSCEECNEVFYCSTECHELAQTLYHPSVCGVTIDRKVWGTELADYLYSLLLMRALALAETQDVHPLELKEVCYIWGDYHGLDLDSSWRCNQQGQPQGGFGSIPQKLPFSFRKNVLFPLHVLEKMDVNIFEQSLRYDTWVFNTLYAKFRGQYPSTLAIWRAIFTNVLKGTASAQHGPDGRPEIAAVHPIWCLTNHSCDPNVAWEWKGSMKFWTREQLIRWQGRQTRIEPGLRAGDEVFSHYCDVRLPVKERREWAIGALGGECMCSRCVWEAADSKGRVDTAA